MKRIIATGLAVTLVAATLGATGGVAVAKDKHWHQGPPPTHHRHYYSHPSSGPNLAAPLLFGTFLGLALAPTLTPPPPPPAYYPGQTSRHVATCTQWYGPWYNPATDTWTDSLGGVHRCTAPY
jgi:hypothetical protein